MTTRNATLASLAAIGETVRVQDRGNGSAWGLDGPVVEAAELIERGVPADVPADRWLVDGDGDNPHHIRYSTKPSPATLAARALGSISTPRKAKSSAANGAKGGRPRLVVTYTEAYRNNVVWQLCRWHAADEAREDRDARGIGPLGRVTHGAHRGICAVCEPRG